MSYNSLILLVEINEEMSELLDKQVWQPNTKLNKGLTASVGGLTGSVWWKKEKKEKNDCPCLTKTMDEQK